MKKRWMLTAVLMLAACQSLPVIEQAPTPAKPIACPAVFSDAPTRFVHRIEARAAGQTQAVMIGVTVVYPREKIISCAVVSAEGLSLFEATSEAGTVKVDRALPPFDQPGFAENMMKDIALIFLAPDGVLSRRGRLADGRTVCRWHRAEGGWIDVSEAEDKKIRIQRYSERGASERFVTIAAQGDRAYAVIELQAFGLPGYFLLMDCMESEAVAPAPAERLVNPKNEGRHP